jgi:hypothetical protein
VVGGVGLGISGYQLGLLYYEDKQAYACKGCETIYYSSRNYSHDLISAPYTSMYKRLQMGHTNKSLQSRLGGTGAISYLIPYPPPPAPLDSPKLLVLYVVAGDDDDEERDKASWISPSFRPLACKNSIFEVNGED